MPGAYRPALERPTAPFVADTLAHTSAARVPRAAGGTNAKALTTLEALPGDAAHPPPQVGPSLTSAALGLCRELKGDGVTAPTFSLLADPSALAAACQEDGFIRIVRRAVVGWYHSEAQAHNPVRKTGQQLVMARPVSS